MPSLETTNLILGVLAAATVAQFLLILGVTVFFARRFAKLQAAVTAFDLAPLEQKVIAATADLHAIAAFTERTGRDVERTLHRAQAVLNAMGTGLGFFAGGYRRAFAVGAGLSSGVREILGRRRPHAATKDNRLTRLGAGT
jgi:hypothetical protein